MLFFLVADGVRISGHTNSPGVLEETFGRVHMWVRGRRLSRARVLTCFSWDDFWSMYVQHVSESPLLGVVVFSSSQEQISMLQDGRPEFIMA